MHDKREQFHDHNDDNDEEDNNKVRLLTPTKYRSASKGT